MDSFAIIVLLVISTNPDDKQIATEYVKTGPLTSCRARSGICLPYLHCGYPKKCCQVMKRICDQKAMCIFCTLQFFGAPATGGVWGVPSPMDDSPNGTTRKGRLERRPSRGPCRA